MRIDNLETLTIFKTRQLEKYHELGYNLIGCGASRGGTSALGILMSYFGFDMGSNVHEKTHEDLDFVQLVLKKRLNELPKLIKRKAAKNPNWAVKLPHAMKCMNVFDEQCPRAVFFIVVRNPLSVAHSLMRHDKSYSESIDNYIRGIEHAGKFYQHLEKLRELKSPFILCEYEKIISKPEQFIKDFVKAVGVSATPEQLNNAAQMISGSGYRSRDIQP